MGDENVCTMEQMYVFYETNIHIW